MDLYSSRLAGSFSWCSARIFHRSKIYDELFKEKSPNQRTNVENNDDANGNEAIPEEDQPNVERDEQTYEIIQMETVESNCRYKGKSFDCPFLPVAFISL